jgi:hypothetical protein
MTLDESYRGKIDLLIIEGGLAEGDPAREVWLDMVDYVARFGRQHLCDRLAEAELMLVEPRA